MSRLTGRMTTSAPRAAASALKRRTSVSHTGVSSEGTVTTIFTLPAKSARVLGASVWSRRVNSGALAPTLGVGPARVTGLPLMVTLGVEEQPQDWVEQDMGFPWM